MKSIKVLLLITVGVTTVAVGSLLGPSKIDPAHRFGWGENIGWTNWQHDAPLPGDGVVAAETFLSGFVWAENVGWINFGDGVPGDGVHYANTDDTNFGVNLDPQSGDLFGLAWGENIGWINFDTAVLGENRARFVDCEHRFFGYAWGENIGWINLNDATHFVAVGPCIAGDLDCDGEVTLDDIASFTLSLGGPGATTACSAFDTDGDTDVDLDDYAEMQRAFMVAP